MSLWWPTIVSKTQQVLAGRVFQPRQLSCGFVTFLVGDLNVIISAAHGGYEWPVHIPDRIAGAWDGERCIWAHDAGPGDADRCPVINQPDKYTEELALCLREDLKKKTARYPYLVLNRLARAKLDPNRPEDEGTFGVPSAVVAWRHYHSCIRQAKSAIRRPALLVDLHGHGHKEGRVELGYLVTGSMLESGLFQPEYSSMHSLVKRTGHTLRQLLTGPYSLGTLLSARGFPTIPSCSCPHPSGHRYHHGGFITRVHGSLGGGSVDAVQVESPLAFRRPDTLPSYSWALAQAIAEFVDRHYQ